MASSSSPFPSPLNLLQPLILVVLQLLLLLVFLVQHPAAIFMSEGIRMGCGDSPYSSTSRHSPSSFTYDEREKKETARRRWEDTKDVVFNEQEQALAQFAVDEANKNAANAKSKITFMHVLKAERRVQGGINYYDLWIQGTVEAGTNYYNPWKQGKVERVAQLFQITVFAGPRYYDWA